MRKITFVSAALVMMWFFLMPGITTRAQDATAAQAAREVRILTWNLKGGSCGLRRSTSLNMRHFYDAIKDYRPGVLLIQEAHANQVASLATLLGTSYTVYFRTTQKCGRRTNFGDAIVSRYTMTDRRFPFLRPQGPAAQRGNPERERILTATIQIGSRKLRIYNTHLSSAGGDAVRDSQARFVLKFIHSEEQRLGPKVWTIWGGDFNMPPTGEHSATYALVTKELRDAWKEGDQNYFDETNPNGFTERAENHFQRIDYLFLMKNAGLKVERAGVIPTAFLTQEDDPNGLSDHRPVIAYLSVR